MELSCAETSQSPVLPMKIPPSKYVPYPSPLARYEEVVSSPQLFMNTLKQLHFAMGTKFMIPTIGGRELDLHRLFVEATSRGGIEKILKEKRWKEVTAVFKFPSTATNASFVLRKYYASLLYHYEQIYYFKARDCVPSSNGDLQIPCITPTSAHRPIKPRYQSPEVHLPAIKQQGISGSDFQTRVPSTGSVVTGVIDGKFDSGYLVTVMIGSEKLKGVLYQAPPHNAAAQMAQPLGIFSNNNETATAATGLKRRRRRKKSEMKRRDPAHPKPNRSGYNFFFAEQHVKLKSLHPVKDRRISGMIGELWTKLNENERAVYQEKARQDKERYRIEMVGYRERLKMGDVISNAVPLQQRFPQQDVGMAEVDAKTETEEGNSPHSMEIESVSDKTDAGDENALAKELDTDMENSVDEEAFELKKRVGDESEESRGDVPEERIAGAVTSEGQ